MSELTFCPNCGTLLDYTTNEDHGTVIQCSNCTYFERVSGQRKLRSTIYHTKGRAGVDSSTIYDNSIKRTSKITCVNSECPSIDPTKWGSYNENGLLVQPDISVINYNSVNKINTYICRICQKMFTPSNDQ